MSDVITANIQVWRQKARDGTLTMEERRQAISAIRAERIGASAKSDTSREKKATVKAKAVPIDSEALLGELGL